MGSWSVSCPPTFAMLGPLSPSHALSVISLAASTSRDCVLVSSCGARLKVPGLLLALYSPLLAPLLGQGQGGVSFPLPLPEIRGLMRFCRGRETRSSSRRLKRLQNYWESQAYTGEKIKRSLTPCHGPVRRKPRPWMCRSY